MESVQITMIATFHITPLLNEFLPVSIFSEAIALTHHAVILIFVLTRLLLCVESFPYSDIAAKELIAANGMWMSAPIGQTKEYAAIKSVAYRMLTERVRSGNWLLDR